jgi:hypothetical protein
MPLQTVFVIELNGLPVRKEFDHYPTHQEIEEEISERFSGGFIYDQFANENIYPRAQVHKFYKLKEDTHE